MRGVDGVDEVAHVAAEPVELPYHEDVAGAQVGQGGGELGAVGLGAGGDIGERPGTPCRFEGVVLQGGALLAGGDAGVADGGHGDYCTVRPLSTTADRTLIV